MRNDTMIWIQAENNPHYHPYGNKNATNTNGYKEKDDTPDAPVVVIWSKSYCTSYIQTKKLFQQNFPTVAVKVHDLNLFPDGGAIETVLQTMTKTKKLDLPIVYVNNQPFCGQDAVQQAFDDGTLQELLFPTPVHKVTGEKTKFDKEGEEKVLEELLDDAKENENDNIGSQLLRSMVEHENNAHEIVVWGKSGPADDKDTMSASSILSSQVAKDLLLKEFPNSKGEDNNGSINMAFHYVNEMPDEQGILEELYHITTTMTNTNKNTVEQEAALAKLPYIFVGGLHMGSTEELEQAIQSGDLKRLIVHQHRSPQKKE
ncbi:hypothetical protein ACA910_012227 [Epithemia clementina (nom. ined.)]